jgi:NhaP-type Na+/H+ or K+/H+ antiporter
MKNRKYGVYGFIGSIVGGAILGIFLSYPIAAILTWLILRKSFAKDSIDDAVVNENPTEVEIDNTENR